MYLVFFMGLYLRLFPVFWLNLIFLGLGMWLSGRALAWNA